MHDKKKIYSIGWGYTYPRSTPLKALFLHEACPWEPAAIVHDESLAPSADGIPILRSEDFLRLAREAPAPLTVILNLQEPTQRQLWLRHAHEIGFELIDEGQILRQTATALAAAGQRCDIGAAVLPDAFDDEAAAALALLKPAWSDAASARVFGAYRLFLQTGLLSPFDRVWADAPSHPLATDGNRFLKSHVTRQPHGLAWEMADRRSNFLEQVCLLAGRRWAYAYAAESTEAAQLQASRLRAAMATLAIPIAVSVCGSDGKLLPLEGAEAPAIAGRHVTARLDLAEPGLWAQRLAQGASTCGLQIALGRHPRQLLLVLQALQTLPTTHLRLACQRPGPLGLLLEWSNAPRSE